MSGLKFIDGIWRRREHSLISIAHRIDRSFANRRKIGSLLARSTAARADSYFSLRAATDRLLAIKLKSRSTFPPLKREVETSHLTYRQIQCDEPQAMPTWSWQLPNQKLTKRTSSLFRQLREDSTEIGWCLFPRLRDSPLGAGGESRNPGKRL